LSCFPWISIVESIFYAPAGIVPEMVRSTKYRARRKLPVMAHCPGLTMPTRGT
jgi:hypothetical protein